jgi:transposase-like protein
MNDQIISGLVAGIFGGIVVLMIAVLKKPVKCPNCGLKAPKFRKPQNRQQALWGGWTCPNCNSEIDRKGIIINKTIK